MALHDAQRIAPILDGIRGLHLLHKRGFRDALGHGGAGHDIRFNKSIAISSPGEDEPWRYTALILVYSLGDAGQLLRGWIAVVVNRSAKHDDGVKSGERRIGNGSQLARDCAPCEHAQNE